MELLKLACRVQLCQWVSHDAKTRDMSPVESAKKITNHVNGLARLAHWTINYKELAAPCTLVEAKDTTMA